MNSDNNCQSPIPLSSLDENRDYYIRVRAISPNINIWANSEYSDYIPLNISD
jgi:hypothetical protein